MSYPLASSVSTASKQSHLTPQRKRDPIQKWYEIIFPCCFSTHQTFETPRKGSLPSKRSKYSETANMGLSSSLLNPLINQAQNRKYYDSHQDRYLLKNNQFSKSDDSLPFLYHIECHTLSGIESIEPSLPLRDSDALIYYEIQKEPSRQLTDFIRQWSDTHTILVGINGDERSRSVCKSFVTQELLGYTRRVLNTHYDIQPVNNQMNMLIMDTHGVLRLQGKIDRIYLDPLDNVDIKEIIDIQSGKLLMQAFKRISTYIFNQLSSLSTHNVEMIFPNYIDVVDLVSILQTAMASKIVTALKTKLVDVVPYVQGIFDYDNNLLWHIVSFRHASFTPTLEFLFKRLQTPLATCPLSIELLQTLVEKCPAVQILRTISKLHNAPQRWNSIIPEQLGPQIAKDYFGINHHSPWIISEQDPLTGPHQRTEKPSCGFSQYSYTNLDPSPVKCEILNSPEIQEESQQDNKSFQSGGPPLANFMKQLRFTTNSTKLNQNAERITPVSRNSTL